MKVSFSKARGIRIRNTLFGRCTSTFSCCAAYWGLKQPLEKKTIKMVSGPCHDGTMPPSWGEPQECGTRRRYQFRKNQEWIRQIGGVFMQWRKTVLKSFTWEKGSWNFWCPGIFEKYSSQEKSWNLISFWNKSRNFVNLNLKPYNS